MGSNDNGASGNMIKLQAEDGFSFDAFECLPEGKAKGGLVIIQEIFGMTDQLKSVSRSYAADGFHVILPALFDRAEPGCVVPFDQAERGRDIMLSLDADKVLLDLAAAIERAGSARRVSVLGFCWGGGQAFWAACEFPLVSATSYYGTRLADMLDQTPRCPVLFHFGETDTHSPPDVIDAVRQAVPTAELHTYDAGHAFANDARPSYVPEAAELARMRSIAFLNEYHRGTG
jgi:carboxymethylenebutenolidase